jgi:hypothetical protein
MSQNCTYAVRETQVLNPQIWQFIAPSNTPEKAIPPLDYVTIVAPNTAYHYRYQYYRHLKLTN